jgi:uncharacterized protein
LLSIGTPLLMFAGAVGHTAAVRISIRVRSCASCTRVGDEHDGALVVRVAAPAVAGQATAAALAVVADAFGVRRSAVTLVLGTTSRNKGCSYRRRRAGSV